MSAVFKLPSIQWSAHCEKNWC